MGIFPRPSELSVLEMCVSREVGRGGVGCAKGTLFN